MSALATKVRKLRELKGLSQENMSLALGISQNAYSKLELGKTQITWDRLTEIAQVLDMDPIKVADFDDAPIFNSNNQSGGNSNINHVNQLIVQDLSEKVIVAYELAISTLKDEVVFLRRELDILRNLNSRD